VSNFAEVIITGAGPSGLRLAGILNRAGIRSVVLEADDRIGGRLLTLDPGIDLGATWFWQNEREVLAVISECELQTFPQYATGDMMYQGVGSVSQIDGNPLNHQAWRIVGGMKEVAQGLFSALPEGTVKLSTRVNSISFQDQVLVSTNLGDWITNKVVIALPPATALAQIDFAPALPERLFDIASRTPVWMGAITKFIAIYETPFWRTMGRAGSAISHVGPMREIHDISAANESYGALFGFSPTPLTAEDGLKQLVEIFGAQANLPNQVLIKDWRDSDLTSPQNVLELTNYQLFGAQELRNSYFDNRLFFSSTETSQEAPGHIQGALLAARRTSEHILKTSQLKLLNE
jgi:monoamine oxidase